MRPNAAKIANPTKRVRMVSLKHVGAATERVGPGRGRASASIAAHRRARAGKVGCGPRGLASERLPGELDVEARRALRANGDLRERRRVAGQIIALVDRDRCRACASRWCAATACRALAIILHVLIKDMPLSEHVCRFGR